MTKTAEIEGLLRTFAQHGHWSPEEERRVKEITIMGRDDDPFIPRRKPFEIEGDWGEPGTKKYDKPELSLDASAPVADRPPPLAVAEPRLSGPSSSLEERVEHLEKMNALLWKAIAKLEGKVPADE